MEEVKLLKTWSTPFGLRVVQALKLKGIGYEAVDEDLSNKSALLLQYNPVYKKVPVLVHNGNPISESLVILEYIDETWKHNPILPEDPFERARERFWAKFNDEKLLPTIWAVFTKEGKEREEAMAASVENLKFVEEELKGKKFFGGEKVGLADLVLGWLANLIGVFEEVTGLKIVDERYPLLLGWMKEFYEVPVIKDTWPPHDKMIIKYQAFYDKYHPA
ncbi:putative glutathione S-transferase [Hibiscus syriacus]|uniref:glutathione transferase n=1 Tax=Hibiscus syriacus TaxID=106335 RepID=A0A6A3BX42_HIBSY|nr:probable glutathione S-transferase [Hibiscus syriacus]KAE8721400.1 putative glutathione S-transferase [Hibiscus syriacus]